MHEKIKTARIEAGLTLKELGEQIGLSAQNTHKYEKGDRTPKLELLTKIAKATKKDISYFLDV